MDKFSMHRAAEVGDLEKVKSLVKEGMSVGILDDYKYTPLHCAAKYGHLEVAKFIISQKIDLDLKSEDGCTAVLVAADRGHKSIVQLLIRSGAGVDGCSEIGEWTLLHHACRLGWTDIVKDLLKNDEIGLNAYTTPLRMTPLLLAASEGHMDTVEILLKAGADVTCVDFDDWSVVHFASKKGWLHMVKQIVEINRSSIDATTDKLMTPLLFAASEGHKEVVEFLIEVGAAVDCHSDSDSWTVLHYACKRNWLQTVKNILQKKDFKGINDVLSNGNTALHIACGMHHTEIVKELLIAGADASVINFAEENALGGTDIHSSAATGDLARLQHLLKLGVPIDSRNENGNTPLHCAAEYDQLTIAEYLISNGCELNLINDDNDTPIICAEENDSESVVNLLVRSGADISCFSSPRYKNTILHSACANSWTDIVQYILQNEMIDVDDQTSGKTPLMYGAQYMNCQTMKLLLMAGANVNICDSAGETALHSAISCENNCDVARLLLESGVNVNATDNRGQTALHYACYNDNEEMIKVLLSAGADLNLKTMYNKTPLHCAVEEEEPCLEVIKVLIEHGAYFSFSDNFNFFNYDWLKEHVLSDVNLCTQLIMNKFNHETLPMVYEKPEYAKRLPPIDRIHIGNTTTKGVESGIESCVESDIETRSFCNVTKICPTVLTLMCVEVLLKPEPTKNKRSTCHALYPVIKRPRLESV